jgi:hypothetical protein
MSRNRVLQNIHLSRLKPITYDEVASLFSTISVGRSIFGEETFAVIFVLRSRKGSRSLIPRLNPPLSDTFALLGLFSSAPVKTR